MPGPAEYNTTHNSINDSSCSSDKKTLRKEIISRRDSIPPEIRLSKDKSVEERLLSHEKIRHARTVMLYASFRSEVSTFNLIKTCLSRGLKTVLPRVDEKADILKLYLVKNLDDLVPGCWGILEPREEKENEVGINNVDIVVAPGVAFDVACNRLGYGKGFYDKMLGARKGLVPFVIGLAYEEQIVPSLPCGPYDIKMDAIITDKRTIERHGH